MEKRVSQCFQIDMTAYLQTHPTSCGSACVIMLLQQYFGITGDKDLEMEIFSQVGYPRNYTGWMAKFLMNHGAKIRHLRDARTLFGDSYLKKAEKTGEVCKAMKLYQELFEIALVSWMGFQCHDWNYQSVINELQKWNPMIVGFWERYAGVLHWVVAVGYTPTSIIILDPLCGEKEIDFKSFDIAIDSSMKKRLLILETQPDQPLTTTHE